MMRQQQITSREVGIDRAIAFILRSECFLGVLSTKAPSLTFNNRRLSSTSANSLCRVRLRHVTPTHSLVNWLNLGCYNELTLFSYKSQKVHVGKGRRFACSISRTCSCDRNVEFCLINRSEVLKSAMLLVRNRTSSLDRRKSSTLLSSGHQDIVMSRSTASENVRFRSFISF